MGKKGGGRVRVKQVGAKAPVNPLADLMENSEPTIIVPPKMDSNISHYFPISESFTMSSKSKLFPCIWPNYIDANKSGKDGRRIGKESAVPKPSVLDISEVLQSIGIRHVVQPYKGYPRDAESAWNNPGRVLYDLEQMKDKYEADAPMIELLEDNNEGDEVPSLSDDGEESFSQKKCWRMIAEKIEDMPGRKQRLEEAKKKEEAEKKKIIEDAKMRAILNSKKQAPTGGSSKKKGKKKK
jgi:signal recognition particle subunit SRP19